MMARGRVLVVSQYRSIDIGGAERYIDETNERLRHQGWEVTHLSVDMDEPQRPLSRPWRLWSAGAHPWWSREVGAVIQDVQPHVLCAHLTVPGLVDVAVRVARRSGLPVCLVHHGDVTGPGWLRRACGVAYDRLVGQSTIAAAQVVLVSGLGYAAGSSRLAPHLSRCQEAPPGVDGALAQAADPWPGLSSPYILFVGKADVAAKGFPVLYRAWHLARATCPDLALVVAGPRPARPWPGVHILGSVNSRHALAGLYAGALATVLPSLTHAESFGMSLAEALVAGCPVIGSDVGGMPALIEPDHNGYLVPPGDAPALAAALLRAWREAGPLRARLAADRDSYRHRFDWDRTAQVLDRCLMQLTGSVPAGAHAPGLPSRGS